MKPSYTLLALVAIFCGSAYGQIVNGSFETNDLSSIDATATSELANTLGGINYTSSTATGWGFVNGAGMIQMKLPSGTTDGKFAAALNGAAQLTQKLTFSSIGGYMISFDVFVEDAGSEGYKYEVVKINGDSSTVIASGRSTKVDTGSALTITDTFRVTSTATSGYIVYIGNNTSDRGYLFVDNVAITPVPEPNGSAFIGLAGLALIFRRRH